MRILTVRQPWAWAIIHGAKNVENRVRNIAGDYRGPVAIHVGLAFPFTRDCQAVQAITGEWPRVTDRWDRVQGTGHIIGVVDLVDVHRPMWDNSCSVEVEGACSPWAEVDGSPHHLVLANPHPLSEPTAFRGALGLRRLDEATTARVLAAIA